MFCDGKKSGLSKATAVVVIVIVVAAVGVGAALATAKTTTVTQTVTQSATVTTTLTSLQTPTANNTIDLRANNRVVLAIVGPATAEFVIGSLSNPTIKVKAGTKIEIFFHSLVDSTGQFPAVHSLVITNSKPPYPEVLRQSDLAPAFPGASTDNPTQPQKDQFILIFTADKPGVYYYICGVDGHASFGMYGQFIVEA